MLDFRKNIEILGAPIEERRVLVYIEPLLQCHISIIIIIEKIWMKNAIDYFDGQFHIKFWNIILENCIKFAQFNINS